MHRILPCIPLCLAAAGAAAQSIVVNGDFDTGLAGWLVDPAVTPPQWVDFDIGAGTSGSVRLDNDSADALDRIYPLEQCMALPWPGLYRIVAHGFIPPGQGGGKLVVSYWLSSDNPDCPMLQGVQAAGGQFITTIDGWGRYEHWIGTSVSSPVPPNARIKIMLGIEKDAAGGSFHGYIDAVSVVGDRVLADGFD